MELIAHRVEGEVGSADSDLFISEYVEGSGWNKALEIYNPSDEGIEPTGCSISVHRDGSMEASATHELTNVIPARETFTLCDSRSDIDPSLCDARVGLSFNGNDAVVPACDGVHLAVVGQVGVDPGEGGGATPVERSTRLCDADASRKAASEGSTSGSGPRTKLTTSRTSGSARATVDSTVAHRAVERHEVSGIITDVA